MPSHGGVKWRRQGLERVRELLQKSCAVWRQVDFWAQALLSMATFLYAWLLVKPPLRYHSVSPEFLWDARFLKRFPARPGGLLEGLAAFGAQLDCRPVLGAAVFAALAGLIVWGIRRLVPRTDSGSAILHWMPVLLLVMLYGQYVPGVLELGGGGLLGVWLLVAWRASSPGGWWGRLLVFWALAGAVFYVGGMSPLLLFVLAGSGIEAIARRTPVSVAGCLLAALWIGLGIVWLPGTDLTAVWKSSSTPLSFGLSIAFYAVLASVLILEAARTSVAARDDRRTAPAGHGVVASWLRRIWPTLGPAHGWTWMAFVAAAVAATCLTFDWRLKALAQIQVDAKEERWETVLRVASRLEAYPASARLQVHRALYHTGRLGSELFAFPQFRGDDLLPSLEAGIDVCPALRDTLLELGYFNLAERYAHEALETRGERPEVLRRLAQINVLIDRPQAARVFLNRLAKIPFQGAQARALLRAIDADPALSKDPFVARARAVRVSADLTEIRFATPMLLEAAWGSNGQNRMAFEYLIAHLLLTGQVEAVVQGLAQFKELGYAELPRHVEEAALVYQQLRGDQTADLAGWQVRPQTSNRFRRYLEVVRRRGGAHATVDPALAREFGDTLWFYGQFGRTYATNRK